MQRYRDEADFSEETCFRGCLSIRATPCIAKRIGEASGLFCVVPDWQDCSSQDVETTARTAGSATTAQGQGLWRRWARSVCLIHCLSSAERSRCRSLCSRDLEAKKCVGQILFDATASAFDCGARPGTTTERNSWSSPEMMRRNCDAVAVDRGSIPKRMSRSPLEAFLTRFKCPTV